MAYDFRANQIRTEKLIVSSALGQHRMLVYPVGVATDLQGTVGFVTTNIGTDVMFFVSGAKGGKGGATANIGLFGGDLVVSGNLVLLAGISGSLQRLNTGEPYIVAGPNINIVTNSLGQIEISSSVSAADPSPWKESAGINIQTTSSVAITGDALFFAPNVGSDVFFFVSGSSTKKAVFGDELTISGNTRIFKNLSVSSASYFSSSVTTFGTLVSSGNFIAVSGLSGSLQRLSDGSPAFIAGDNITVVTQSNGAIAISSSFSRQNIIDLLYPSQSVSLTSSASWTDVSSGGGSVTIASGTLIGTIPGSTAAVIVAASTLTWGWDTVFEIRARVEITGDTVVDAKGHLRILYGADGFFVVPCGDGSLSLIRTLGSFASLASAVSRPIDGTGWVRMRIVGQRITLWYGTGVGSTEPTSWTLMYDSDQAGLIGVASPTALHLGGQYEAGGGLATTTTFEWSSVTIRSLSGVG